MVTEGSTGGDFACFFQLSTQHSVAFGRGERIWPPARPARCRSQEIRRPFPSSGRRSPASNPLDSQFNIVTLWSGREDLNLRHPAPKAGALPGCATPRHIQCQMLNDECSMYMLHDGGLRRSAIQHSSFNIHHLHAEDLTYFCKGLRAMADRVLVIRRQLSQGLS